MDNRKDIARHAFAEALRMRRAAGQGMYGAICIYDLAERLGVEVRFTDIPSMEGMYLGGVSPTIILSSLRPPGRRAFTCAHELGHHNNGDGTVIDHLVERENLPTFEVQEFRADCFAGALLMPKTAVEKAFALRGCTIMDCTPGQVYIVSNYFGVGYETLVQHMHRSLHLLPEDRAATLNRVRPRRAQAMALGWETLEPICIVDSHWTQRSIDVETGDLIFVYGAPILDGGCLERVQITRLGSLFRAKRPGIGKIEDSVGLSAFVRVSKRGFVGRSLFRHLEEVDSEYPNDY